jgi:hypothetical protein
MRHDDGNGYLVLLVIGTVLRLMFPLFKRLADGFDRVFKCGKYNPDRN